MGNNQVSCLIQITKVIRWTPDHPWNDEKSNPLKGKK